MSLDIKYIWNFDNINEQKYHLAHCTLRIISITGPTLKQIEQAVQCTYTDYRLNGTVIKKNQSLPNLKR